MAVPITVADGSQPFGVIIGSSGTITIDGVAYIVTDFTPTRSVAEAQDFKANGSPNRQRKTAGFDTFSATLQLATSATTYPQFGDVFQATCDSNYGAENWCLDPVAVPQSNSPTEIRTCPITGFKLYNGASPVITTS